MIRRAKEKDPKFYPNHEEVLSIPQGTKAGRLEEGEKALASFLFHQDNELDAN